MVLPVDLLHDLDATRLSQEDPDRAVVRHDVKRVRVAVSLADSQHEQQARDTGSALTDTHDSHLSPDRVVMTPTGYPIQPLVRTERSTKKNKTVAARSRQDLFVQESFKFPARQIWLQSKIKQRKPTVPMNQGSSTTIDSAQNRGEALALGEDTDRIAALIRQKRQENESKLYRERMVLQQRLYRGETNAQDRLIAASHDILRKKMELSAKGIFEEIAPPKAPQVCKSKSDCSADTTPILRRRGLRNVVPKGVGRKQERKQNLVSNSRKGSPINYINDQNLKADDFPASMKSSGVIGENAVASNNLLIDKNHELHSPTFFEVADSSQSHASTIGKHTPTLSEPSYHDGAFNFSQSNTHVNVWRAEERLLPRLTSQMWNALPSTSTPRLTQASVLRSTHTPQIDRPVRHPHTCLEYSTSGLPAPQHCAPNSPISSSISEPAGLGRSDIQPSDTSTNRNMFTGQAREDGFNSAIDHFTEPEKRRNMFSTRT